MPEADKPAMPIIMLNKELKDDYGFDNEELANSIVSLVSGFTTYAPDYKLEEAFDYRMATGSCVMHMSVDYNLNMTCIRVKCIGHDNNGKWIDLTTEQDLFASITCTNETLQSVNERQLYQYVIDSLQT